jgi:hypothetical protein
MHRTPEIKPDTRELMPSKVTECGVYLKDDHGAIGGAEAKGVSARFSLREEGGASTEHFFGTSAQPSAAALSRPTTAQASGLVG